MLNRHYLKAILFLFLFIIMSCGGKEVIFEVANQLDMERPNEVVEISGDTLRNHFLNEELPFLQVFDHATRELVVSQLINYNKNKTYDNFCFQIDMDANSAKKFLLKVASDTPKVDSKSKVYARFVPERMDDFAWENDRIAFRMYGPALEAEGPGSGSGVDVWVKSTKELILDKWYKGKDYHKDHGEGFDGYKVGTSRGCGGIALWEQNWENWGAYEAYTSKNFNKWHILANGPFRTAFQLDFQPWELDNGPVLEYKKVELDAGSNLNRFGSIFYSDDYQKTGFVIGISKADGGIFKADSANGWMRYWQPMKDAEKDGYVGCGVVIDPKKIKKIFEYDNNHYILVATEMSVPTEYYGGACWSKSGDFSTVDDWDSYLANFAKKLASPLKVEIQK